ncbi:MFS transport protein AraJ, partial [Salmonella enterica subsp. enterica serovar Enteritidis str. SE30663]
MKKVIFSLALGTFGLGMAEFGIMGVLTELARDVGITIPAAGHMISFYAFGVVLGAPVMALFSSRFSLKHILLFLVTLCVMGNAIFTFSSSYLMLAVGRLVSGFPHGAFLASAPLSCQDYPPRESHRRRRGYGFRDDGGES